jgi:hypothetical protein
MRDQPKTKRLQPDAPTGALAAPRRKVLLKEERVAALVRRLNGSGATALLPAPTSGQPTTPVSEQMNLAIGCKTDDVALGLRSQIVALSTELDLGTATEYQIDRAVEMATAKLAELQPTTATEAMLAVQMIGAQKAAMEFLRRSLFTGQEVEMVDRHVTRAVKLMRVFTEQLEAMAKLKGKSGQQRVVVEHVTVAAGGQAIVGTVIPGGNPGGEVSHLG